MLDGGGTVLDTTKLLDVSRDDVDFGATISLDQSSPTWCECTVPSATTITCSFI